MPHTETSRKPVAVARGRDLGDEYLFYDRDHDRIHVLNVTARAIFLLCDGAHTEKEIAATLAAQFKIDEAEARSDARELVQTLVELGLVGYH
jgi:PqqD family protein of HPr-rel-A system